LLRARQGLKLNPTGGSDTPARHDRRHFFEACDMAGAPYCLERFPSRCMGFTSDTIDGQALSNPRHHTSE
jgi:hypothetical protein